MGWAVNTPYCHEEMTVGGKTIYLTCKTVSAGNYQLKIESTETMTGLGGSFCYQNGVAGYQLNAAGHFNVAGDGKTITCDIESTSAPNLYTPLYVIFSEGGQKEYSWPSDVDWTANCGETCSDAEKPTISAVAASDITYKSVVLTVTATDNVGVTRYIVKNGDTQIASSATSPVTVDGLSGGTTYNNIKVIARDACGNESDAFSVSSFTTETLTYCRYATGHLANPNFGDIYGRILVTIKKVDNSTIGVKVEPNNNGTKGIKYLNIIVNNVGHEYGNNDGSGDDLTGYFNISGLSSLDFNININFYCNTPNWTTQQFSVTEDQLCDESPVVLSEGSEYCGDYGVECDRHNGAYAYLKWETTEDGDVVITMVDGTGSTNARFRGNNGMGENLNGFTVLSGTGFAASEPASNYFTRVYVANGNTFKLQRKGGAVLPSPAKIRFASPAVEWYCTQDGDGYAWPTYEYTYGKTCPVISGYSVSASANNGTMGAVSAKVGDADVTNVDAGTTVRFTATANDTYEFVNWTKNDVVVSTNPVYDLEINENTYLTANFDYIRNTYCHTQVSSEEGKKFYLTLGSIGGGQYQIKFEGSSEAKITGLNDANFVMDGVRTSWDTDGQGCPFTKANGAWTFNANGYGSCYTTFELADGKTWKDIYAGVHYMYFACEGLGQQTLTAAFPNRYRIAWTESCADTEAPVLAAPTAAALNTTDVQLTLSATDNWEGFITYTINYKPTGDTGEGVTITPAPVRASGVEFTVNVLGLTTNTEYTFTVTASDGANVSAAQTCKVTPAGDVAAPTDVTISGMALTDHIVRLTLFANDNYAGDITYNIVYDNAGIASTSAPRGETTTLDIAGLDANTDYHFVVVATDAANNSADAVNAATVHTYATNLAKNQPSYAGAEAAPGNLADDSNDGDKNTRWASGGWSSGYPDNIHGEGADSQDWWYVDLGAVYDIKNIRMFWEGACPSKYKFFTSNDATSWTPIANITSSPHVGNSDADANDYFNVIDANAQGRYLKVWGYEDTNNNWAYGISFWELEAYGTLATDVTAPVISAFTASGASTTSVLLHATADDNFKGDLTYTFYCNDVAQANPVVMPAGQEATYTVNGLTMGTNYDFKVNVSDGTNNTMSDVVVGSPIADNQAPTDVMVVTKSRTDEEIVLTLSANDNLGGMIYYTVTMGETVKNAQAMSGVEVDVTFGGLDYDTPYAFSVVAKDGSDNAADAVAHNETTKPATYPTSYAPAPAFAEASVRPVYSSAYNKNCNFYDWGGSPVEKQTYGAKKLNHSATYFGIADFGTIKLDADDELYLSVWTNENISFKVVPIIRNAENTANLPERGAFTQTLTGGQWNVVSFTMSDFVLNDADAEAGANDNYDRIYQIKIDHAGNQTFWLDNIYFHRHGAMNETDNAAFIATNDNEGQDVAIARTFPNTDEWYTLCLPFDLSDAQLTEVFGAGYTLAEMVGAEDRGSLLHLNFDYIHSFEAGKAYLLRPGTSVTTAPTFNGVTIKNVNPATLKSTNTYMEFQGTFESILLNSDNQRFVGPENYLYSPATNGTTMKAFRCYFTIPNSSPLAGAPGKRAKIVFGPQATTDIENVQDNVQCTKVLRDGQLYIIRDGRTYDAQGQLIK